MYFAYSLTLATDWPFLVAARQGMCLSKNQNLVLEGQRLSAAFVVEADVVYEVAQQ